LNLGYTENKSKKAVFVVRQRLINGLARVIKLYTTLFHHHNMVA